jgi:hypothetical protein
MSGDCGHGWQYHTSRSEPCQKCYDEYKKLKAERDALQALREKGPVLKRRLVDINRQMLHLIENW